MTEAAAARTDPIGVPEPTELLVNVMLLRFPLRLWARSQEHYDGLIREFTLLLLAEGDPERHHLPARLLDLVARLTAQYATANAAPDAVRDSALQAGERVIDLHFLTPVAAGAASVDLAQMLKEADEYCRAGTELLTLAVPDDIAAFVEWYLGEFIAQLAGDEPRAWPGGLD